MAIPQNTIEEEVLNRPAEKRIKLAEKLMASVKVFCHARNRGRLEHGDHGDHHAGEGNPRRPGGRNPSG
jgi:hypothetical protein